MFAIAAMSDEKAISRLIQHAEIIKLFCFILFIVLTFGKYLSQMN